MKRATAYFILVLIIVAGCSAYRTVQFKKQYGPVRTVDRTVSAYKPGEVSFYEEVQPILERRCDVCHGCYDAPCQLKLTCYEGLERGGTTKLVYTTRLRPEKPTRLFIDASSVEEWRQMGFHPVLNERDQTPQANLENSVVNLMLQLKKENPQPETELLPDSFDISKDKKQNCTTAEDFSEYKKKYPLWGMPYALPGLTDKEHKTIVEWLRQGGLIIPRPPMSAKAKQIINQWEEFFNSSSLKQQLVSRYIYEHLFIGHIHFDTLPDREFYRLVRSKTGPGEPVVEINTVRPYDHPGVEKFYYRFRKIETTIVVKNHTVYRMNSKKMERYRQLFLRDDYEVSKLPSYDPETASNPFKTFVDLPAKSRYRFLLDDAQYIVMAFIKGPVCRGQIALNVINDHFFVAFFDPEKDTISNDTAFIARVSDFLDLPASGENKLNIMSFLTDYQKKQSQYLDAKGKYLAKMDPAKKGNDITHIWNGDGHNDNALLTVFRHFDSASVVKGFVGDTPKTGWVIDFPLLERIYYLLVAGFNVFGNAGHQLETRLYMDFLRMEGENNLLSFLPKDKRKEIRADWYKGARAEHKNQLENPFRGLKWDTGIVYRTNDPKKEFFAKILEHVGPAAGPKDYLNRCPEKNCVDKNTGPLEQRADLALQKVTGLRGPEIQVVKDLDFVRVVTGNKDKDLAYTVIRNKALSNNSFMFEEERRRIVKDDTLTIVKGHLGGYPNSFTRVNLDEIEEFVEGFLKIRDQLSYYNLARKYAIRRTSKNFWEEADWHYQKYLKDEPVEAGLFDMYRFDRIAEKSDAEFKW
ncbi:MAG: fatty acid cis/trans isomerase [Syntrophobacteria bacterium]